jgi:cell division transport system permease protein
MMFQWLFASQSERRILPGGRLRGPTPYVIAIMIFAMMIVAAAGLALANAAGVVARGAQNRYAVQLPDSSALRQSLSSVRSAPGVLSATPIPENEMRDTLERWLGPMAQSKDLPVPAMIDIELAAGADEAGIRARVEQAVPGARLVGQSETLAPLLHSIRVLQWLALVLVVLMAGAAAAAVVLAARGALDTHRFTIEVMHGIGATDEQVAHLFQRKIALDAMAGALAGGIGAALVLILIAGGGAALASEIAGTAPLSALDLFILALMPIAAVVLATWVARTAVLATLRRSL